MARIGEVLLQHGWIDAADLRRALAEQSLAGGKRICSLLIARGVLDPDNAAKALSQQHDVPAVLQRHLEARDHSLAALLPGVVARMHFALPIGRTRGGEIIVCVREPSPDVQIAIRKAITTPVMIAVAPASQLEDLIDHAYEHEDFEVDLGTAGDIAPPSADTQGNLLVTPGEEPSMPEIGAFSLVELDDVRVNKDLTTSQAELKLPQRTTPPPFNAVTPPFGSVTTPSQPARQTLPPRTTPGPAMPSGPFASITPPSGTHIQPELEPQDVDVDLAISAQPTEDVPPPTEDVPPPTEDDIDLSITRSATSTAWPPPDVRTPAPPSRPPATRLPTTPPTNTSENVAVRIKTPALGVPTTPSAIETAPTLPALKTPPTGVPVIPSPPTPPAPAPVPPSNPPSAPAFAVRYSKPPITPPIRPNPIDHDASTSRPVLPPIGRSTPPTGTPSAGRYTTPPANESGRTTPPTGVASAGRYSSTTPPTETPARYASSTPTQEVLRGAGRYASTTPPKDEPAGGRYSSTTPPKDELAGRYSNTTPPAETSTRYSSTKPPAARHTTTPPSERTAASQSEAPKRPSDRYSTAAPQSESPKRPSDRHSTAAPSESSGRQSPDASPSRSHPTAPPDASSRPSITTPPDSKQPAGKPSTTKPPANRLSIDAVVDALADAVDGDSATDVAMRFASLRWASSLLLAVKEGAALGQRGHGAQLSGEIVRAVAIPLESPSIVKAAYDSKRLALESPPDAGAVQERVVKLLGQPGQPSAAPIVVANRISHVFVVGDLVDDGVDGPAELSSLAAALGEAYQRGGRPMK